VRIRRRHILRSRRGALDAGIIILGIIVSIVAIVAATLTWSDVLEVSYVNLITAKKAATGILRSIKSSATLRLQHL
jgi:hypothetical protein